MDAPPPENTPSDANTEAMVRLAGLWASAMPAVEAFVFAMVHDPHDREDVIQETSAYLARNFHTFEQGTSFVGWAVTAARFRVKELYRDRSRDRLILAGDAMEPIADAAVRLRHEAGERQDALSQCLGRLKGHQRQLLEMRYSQSLAPAAISEQVGKTPNAVSAALLRIRTALRRCIEARLGAGPAEPEGGAR